MAAAIIGSEAFFEPFTVTVPESRTGPSMRNTSILIFLANNGPITLILSSLPQRHKGTKKLMIQEIIKELVGKANVIDLIICVGGVLVLAVWLLKTSLGTKALVNSPVRRNDMPPYLALIPPFFWFLAVWLLGLVKEKAFPELSGSQGAFADNLVMCLGAAPVVITSLVIARIHFACRLKGFGLNPKTIARDLVAGLLNLLATMPVVLSVIILITVAGKIFVGSDYQMPRHEELTQIMAYPQWQIRALIVFTAIVVVPFTEEVLFRGIFQTLLRSYLNRPWPAIILASLIFIIFHANPEHWPALFPLALCFGYAYEKSGSLFRSIFAHSLFNAMSIFAALSQ
jgi:membrane protease YdiL (CAAX protease family)